MLGNEKIVVKYERSIATNATTRITLKIDNVFGMVTDARACYNRHGEAPGAEASCALQYNPEESGESYSIFTGEISFATPGYRTFYIQLYLDGQYKLIEYDTNSHEAVLTDQHGKAFWQVYAYYAEFKTPDWLKGGIMYQIYVDTFCSKDLPEHLKDKVVTWTTFPKWRPDDDGIYRNNQFYGGNLRGIISKLNYLKSFNVTVIYLTPILKSSSSNRYDIDDYEQIDDMVGSWDDLKELHEKANFLGMKLIVDMVFNHSGSGNELITKEPEMYDWINRYTEAKCWWGYKNLVEFNKNSDKFYEYLFRWLKKYSGFMDGIRLDVADNLPDRVLAFIREHFGLYVLGEVWKNAVLGDGRDFLIGDKLDGVMNYQTAIAIYRYLRWGNFGNFKQIMHELSLYPPQALDVSPIFLSSHDTPRISNIVVGDFMQEDPKFETVWAMEQNDYWLENGAFDTYKFRSWEYEHDSIPDDKASLARSRKKLAIFMQYTLPGLPAVFAGEEAGVTGFKDPFNRKPFPWDNIDQDMYDFYVTMGSFRIAHREIFADSRNFQILYADEQKMIYRRGEMRFIINITGMDVSSNFDLSGASFKLRDADNAFVLPAYTAVAI